MKLKINKFELIRTTVALSIAILLTFLVILLISDDPFTAIKTFVVGPIDSVRHIGNVIELMIPLVFVGLGLGIIFSSNEFNIAASGVFLLSTMVASAVAIYTPIDGLFGTLLVLLAGSCIGMLAMSIPGVLKVKFGVNELVVSLMLNYVLYQVVSYVITYYLRDHTFGAWASVKFNPTVTFPKIIESTRIHSGLYFAIVAVILSYLFLYKTKWGYEIRTVGLNANFAKYSGIKTGFAIILAQLVGGFLIGLGGSVEMLGMYQRYQYQVIPSYGFDAIIVAIIAKNNPALIPLAALFLAYIRIGADIMSRYTDVTSEIVIIIQGLVIVLLVAESFLAKTRFKSMVKTIQEKES